MDRTPPGGKSTICLGSWSSSFETDASNYGKVLRKPVQEIKVEEAAQTEIESKENFTQTAPLVPMIPNNIFSHRQDTLKTPTKRQFGNMGNKSVLFTPESSPVKEKGIPRKPQSRGSQIVFEYPAEKQATPPASPLKEMVHGKSTGFHGIR